jgi:hypothetical protein
MLTHTPSTAQPNVGFFIRLFYNLLENKLPRRFKRLIYVSSILGLIKQMRDPDMAMVKKLNDTFKLAQHPDAFAFPMYIKSVIWKGMIDEAVIIHNNEEVSIGNLIEKDLSTKDYAVIGEHFASKAPKWLKYGSFELMVNDIIMLIKHLQLFKSSTQPAAAI